jgi:peptidyl-prolyl cis-trans isomerase SurA
MQARGSRRLLALVAGAWIAASPSPAEVIEEIVAWVEADIITLSDLKTAEQEMIQALYRSYAGEELDRRLREGREGLLMDLVDQKILLRRAERLFAMDRLADSYLKAFKEQQEIESDAELERMLGQAGMTLAELRRKLVERYAPREVVRTEVESRVAVGDGEVAAYYEAHRDEFLVPAQVTLREIVLLAEGAAKDGRRDEAEALRARAIQPGVDFASLAAEVSEAGTRTGGGQLGPLRRGELARRLEEVAFTLPVGQVSEVLEMPYGFHLVKVENRTEDRVRSLDEVREELGKRLDEQKYQQALREFLNKVRQEADWKVNPKYQNYLTLESSG